MPTTTLSSVADQQRGPLLALARGILRDEEDARDAVQDGLVSAVRAAGGFEERARLSTWLHRIVMNAALMKLRARRRRREDPITALLPRFLEDGRHAERVREWHVSAESAAERTEIRALVRSAIRRLPAHYRDVLVLRDIHELDTEETAGALGITPNAVKIRLHRARQALRTLLAPEFERTPFRSGGR